MKNQYRLFTRGKVFYQEDRTTRKQTSLGTTSKEVALRILNAKNEALQNPYVNIQIARA